MAQHYLLLLLPLVLLFVSPPTAANSVILDTDGNPLETGSRYYVLTSGRGGRGRGGLTAISRPLQLCPMYVGQLSNWQDEGMPVSFYPADPSQKEITEGVEVNIAFGGPNYCRNQGVWQFDRPYITTNGVIGNPGFDTFPNWFKIQKTDEFGTGYKILYCFVTPAPANGLSARDSCDQLDANIHRFNGVSLLGLAPIDNPLSFFGFIFKKATTTASYF